MQQKTEIAGVILAGGHATRMAGQDKSLLQLNGEPILSHIIRRAAPQVSRLLLSLNRHPDKFSRFRLPIIADRSRAGSGPLAGIYSAMVWLEQQHPSTEFLACFPADVPWFPAHIVEDLLQRASESDSLVAWSAQGEQVQPLFSLWSLCLRAQLGDLLAAGRCGPMQVIPSLANVCLDYDKVPGHYFLNINTPEDLEVARNLASNAGQYD